MALIPETGSGVHGANTWADMQYADDYHEARNNTKWIDGSVSDENKEAALIYSTEWINNIPLSWWGYKASLDPDVLNWPRASAYGRGQVHFGGVPDALKRAECELALAHLTKSLNEVLSRGGALSSVWVGPITVSYEPNARPDRAYPMVFRILTPLHRGTSSTFLHRAVRG